MPKNTKNAAATTAATTTATRRPYLASNVGKTAKGEPFAYTLEGYIGSSAPFFAEAKDDKSAYLNVSMGLRGSAERIMARANGTYDSKATYGKVDEAGQESDEFASIRIYGDMAEKLNEANVLTKGRHVVVSGRLKIQNYKTKSGGDGQELIVEAANVVDLGSRKNGIDPVISNTVGAATRTYTTKDGVVHTENLATGFIGTVINSKGLEISDSGVKHLSFGIKGGLPAEKVHDLANGIDTKDKEYDPKRAIVNAVVFGDQAERLSKVIRDNAIVVVSGPIEVRDYNGNISYQMRPRDVIIAKYAPSETPASGTAAAETSAAAPAYYVPEDDGDDGELPF